MKRNLIAILASFVTIGVAESQTAPPPIVRPGAPGESGWRISATEASDLAGTHYSEANVRFLRRMISHHGQALQMAGLVPSRSDREVTKTLANDIELAEKGELQTMQVVDNGEVHRVLVKLGASAL